MSDTDGDAMTKSEEVWAVRVNNGEFGVSSWRWLSASTESQLLNAVGSLDIRGNLMRTKIYLLDGKWRIKYNDGEYPVVLCS